MEPLKIFLSHGSKYVDIAKSMKLSLLALESDVPLDIRISTEMAGAIDWRVWIEDNVRAANVFLLVYPHASMEMAWCNYELGRFYDRRGHIACIKNVDIDKPPPAFEPYQAYTADEEGLLKFLHELFVTGAFTSGRPINAAVGQMANAFFARAKGVARELAQKFADARVHEQFYERRVVMSVQYRDGHFDPVRTLVEGNPEGLGLLGLHNRATVSWSKVRASLRNRCDWPDELERSLPAIAGGSLPPSLSPFLDGDDVYIPVVAKAETVDEVLRKVVVIFVAGAKEHLRPLLDWQTPPAMPDSFAMLIRLVRMMLRARWDILEPAYREARRGSPTKEQIDAIVHDVSRAFERMSRDAAAQGINGLDQFFTVFDHAVRPTVKSLVKEYRESMRVFSAAAANSDADLARCLEILLDNNASWLQVAGRQFGFAVDALQTYGERGLPSSVEPKLPPVNEAVPLRARH